MVCNITYRYRYDILFMGVIRAVHSTGAEEAAAPDKKTQFFLNIVFEFAELFLVAILLRNHTKIN